MQNDSWSIQQIMREIHKIQPIAHDILNDLEVVQIQSLIMTMSVCRTDEFDLQEFHYIFAINQLDVCVCIHWNWNLPLK